MADDVKKIEGNKVKIIIKKVPAEGGAHGGSWKVAYADFVTAMMAFFLLMWLISMAASGKKEAVANYFKNFNVFDNTSGAAIDMQYQQAEQARLMQQQTEDIFSGPADGAGQGESLEVIAMKEKLKDAIREKLQEYSDQVVVVVTKNGVRIEVMDNEGKAIFPIGSARMETKGKEILRVISDNIKDLDNKIAIEGHTDALSYATSKYTNWELSTERASAARIELQNNGIVPDRIATVSGYAATMPLIRDNPDDPRNRRISINVIYNGAVPAV